MLWINHIISNVRRQKKLFFFLLSIFLKKTVFFPVNVLPYVFHFLFDVYYSKQNYFYHENYSFVLDFFFRRQKL